MNKILSKIEELRGLIDRLSTREKMLLLLVSAGVVIFLVSAAGIGINISLAKMKDRLESKRELYERIVSLQERYSKAQEEIKRIQAEMEQNRDVQLASVISTVAEQVGIGSAITMTESKGAVDKKAGIKERTVKVEMRRVGLPELLQFMENVEQTNKTIFIRSLNLRPQYDNREELSVTCNISQFVPIGDEG